MSDELDPQAQFELLAEATQRLVRTVDGLDDEQLAAPSGLPDWTRGHVVAHLALNAEGMAGVLESRIEGQPRSMYASDEARAGDIEELAAADRDRAARRGSWPARRWSRTRSTGCPTSSGPSPSNGRRAAG